MPLSRASTPPNQAVYEECAFRRRGNFSKSEENYEEASIVDPNNPAPLISLCSTNFERGDYCNAINYIQKVLSLSQARNLESQDMQNLYYRAAQCFLYLSRPEPAKVMAQNISDRSMRTALLYATEKMQIFHEQVDLATHRSLVMDRLHRFKPSLSQIPEYFPTGHDKADSLFDEMLQKSITPQDDIALLFCGSGDARHVFATILSTASKERLIETKLCRNIHFTMVDHSPPVFARNLLMFEMLSHYWVLKSQNTPGYEDMMSVMAYIYTCHLVPPYVYEKALEYIDRLLNKLGPGKLSTPGLLLASKDIPAVTHVLRQWRQGLGSEYCVANVRTYLSQAVETHGFLAMALDQARAGEFDRKSFKDLGVLFSTHSFVENREPAIYNLIDGFSRNNEIQEISAYINDNWKINPTLFDLDLENLRGQEYGLFTTLEFLPMSIVNRFESVVKTPSLTIPDFGQILDNLGHALFNLEHRLTIELIIGDMAAVMDRIRYDILEHRMGMSVSKQYPKVYDRIHLSNIPDYVGGPLTVFTCCPALLSKDRASTLQFRCLLNPSRFRGHQDFQSEYLNMYDNDQIAQHFHLRRQPSAADSNPKRHELAVSTNEYLSAFVLEYYMTWEYQDEGPIGVDEGLSKSSFEKWVYSILLKICLPYERTLISDRPVESPLNLTQFFRLLVHLSEIGYPAHWLSNIIRTVCSGTIDTTARAPCELIATPEVLDVDHPNETLNLQPWTSELTTLLSIWYNLLPFGHIPTSNCISPLSAISQYSVTFPSFRSGNLHLPRFMILLWNVETAPQPPTDIRHFLLNQLRSTTATHDIHIVTCFQHNIYINTSKFWLRDDVVETIKLGSWKVYIARTDSWAVESQGVEASHGLIKLERWL